ncbi:MAG TPA: zinc ribbon domain-containing protein [Terriglobales bacterium]|nr:zinc ribbon domain-containing protein [Terriglobales bacterium]
MFCPSCGTENPAQAAFCLKCGASLPQSVPGQVFLAPPAAFLGAPAPPVPSPYLWGYIHGWGMLVVSPLLFLLFLAVLLDPKSDSETRLGAGILMLLLGLAALTGFGLVRKSKMGMILVFVWAGLHVFFVGICLLALVAQPKEPTFLIMLLMVLVGLAFWIACSVYYYHRRHIFR